MKRRSLLTCSISLASLGAMRAVAQQWPERPIRLICPFPAGGPTDIVLRAFADHVGPALGGSMVVENKSGAAGLLGAIEVSTARPDGYTLTQLNASLPRLAMMQKLTFDPLSDITWIVGLAGYTLGLAVRADSPWRTLKEFITDARARPGEITYAATAVGTATHMVVEDLAQQAGMRLRHVPFRGAADAQQAILGGHVMAWSDVGGWAAGVDSGALRLLSTFGAKPSRRWPQVPTAASLGYDMKWDIPFGVGGPKGMDPAVVRRLQDAFASAVRDPAVLAMLSKFDLHPLYQSTEDYQRFARDTAVRERALVARAGLLLNP